MQGDDLMGYRHISEGVNELKEHLEQMKDAVQVREEENALVLSAKKGHEYRVSLDSIKIGPRGVLYWVLHLSEKEWFTREMMERFIIVASDVAGFNPHQAVDDNE